MTETWLREQFGGPEWAAPSGNDLEDVVQRGRRARRRRAIRRGAGGTLAAAVLAGGLTAGVRLDAGHPQTAALGPADAPNDSADPNASPTATESSSPAASGADLTACAGADTPAGEAVAADVAGVGSMDYRSDTDYGQFATPQFAADTAAKVNAMRSNLVANKTSLVATTLETGYIDGGCDHPRYLVTFTRDTTSSTAPPTHSLFVYVASVVPADGTYKLDSLTVVDPP